MLWMRKSHLGVVLALSTAALALAGCGRSLEQQLVGKWKAQLSVKATSSDKPEDQLAKTMVEGFGNMMASAMSLELKPDKTFTQSVMGMPVEGKWSLTGNVLELKTEKVMGMGNIQFEEQTKKDPNATVKMQNSDGMGRYTVSADGKTLTPIEDKAKPKENDADMVFVKDEAK